MVLKSIRAMCNCLRLGLRACVHRAKKTYSEFVATTRVMHVNMARAPNRDKAGASSPPPSASSSAWVFSWKNK